MPLPPSTETHDLGARIFEEVHRHLESNGLKVSTGTIVDATIILRRHRPRTDKVARSRDEADQEGQSVVFRHEGAYRRGRGFGLVHSVAVTSAKFIATAGGDRSCSTARRKLRLATAPSGQQGRSLEAVEPKARCHRGTPLKRKKGALDEAAPASTERRRGCAPRSSTRSAWSSASSATSRRAIAGYPRTPIGCSSPARWPISTSRAASS